MEIDNDLRADIEVAKLVHRALMESIEAQLISRPVDVGAPSLLPGWTRGHVLAHITHSGDGHLNMFAGAVLGEVRAQYPNGLDGRAAAIETGARRTVAEHLALLAASIDRLEAAWDSSSWNGSGTTPRGGSVQLTELPFLRTREVAIHHIDLDIGADFDGLPRRYLRRELSRMEMLWRAKQPMGMGSLPAAALDLEPPVRLAWLMGRATVEGLGRADVF